MKRRTVILYWLLLLVPTLAVGAVLFQLLLHEQDRIDQQARSSAHDRAQTIAEALQITVEEVEDQLTQALRTIPGVGVLQTLQTWEESNPLVRNIFIWRPRSGLHYPASDATGTTEERRFIARYGELFAPRGVWRHADAEGQGHVLASRRDAGQAAVSRQAQEGQQTRNLVQAVQQLRVTRRQLKQMAKGASKGNAADRGQPAETSGQGSGWIPWFAENRLYILGWIAGDQGDQIYGIELELMTLLARLVADFPSAAPEGTVYALVDGGGRILHQAGDFPLDAGRKPKVTVSLAPRLPHWEVAVYFVGNGATKNAERTFIILSGLLLAIFVATIVLGGSLLLWQAHRNMVDAVQKTNFVSNVSHELKTPLTSIRMYAELLGEERVTDPGKRKRYLEVIIAESQRLTRLVNNVLDFSRLEQGRKKYHLADLELAAFVRQTIEAHRLRIQQAGLELIDDIAEEEAYTFTDRDAIEQAMLNVIDNAVKYAADGRDLVVTASRRNDWYEIRFKDRGPGVPRVQQEKIFETFHRVDDSLTAKQPGTGLGLSIARRILRDLGGDLLYEPREGGGSCFLIRIPIQ